MRVIDPLVIVSHSILVENGRPSASWCQVSGAEFEVVQHSGDNIWSALYRTFIPQTEHIQLPVLPSTKLIHSQGVVPRTLGWSLRLYPNEICVVRLEVDLRGEFQVNELNGFVNSLVSGAIQIAEPGHLPRTASEQSIHLLTLSEMIGASVERPLVVPFSTVIARGIVPNEVREQSGALKAEEELDVYAAAIRRIPDVRELDIAYMRTRQRNLSLYRDDLVYLNYHNLFLYVKGGVGHLSESFYIDACEAVRSVAARLVAFDAQTHVLIQEIDRMPRGIGRLKRSTEMAEAKRLEIMQALDTYRFLIATAATRGEVFLRGCADVFGTDALRARVEEKLREVEVLLAERYSLSVQKSLQLYAIAVGVVGIGVSILVALLGVFISKN